MNLLEALEKKKALDSYIQSLISNLKDNLYDMESLSSVLETIDKSIDDLYQLESKINRTYNKTFITETETISDIVCHADGLSEKIEVLKNLILVSNIEELSTKSKNNVDSSIVLKTVIHYEELKNSLVKKIKEVCASTDLLN